MRGSRRSTRSRPRRLEPRRSFASKAATSRRRCRSEAECGRSASTSVPGYRVYFGRYGRELVSLLAGGSKRGQSADIERAQADWLNFKTRRRERVALTRAFRETVIERVEADPAFARALLAESVQALLAGDTETG